MARKRVERFVVELADRPPGWALVSDRSGPVPEVAEYLLALTAGGASVLTIRSYTYDLLRWWRWLTVRGVRWDCASPVDVRDVVDLPPKAAPHLRHELTVPFTQTEYIYGGEVLLGQRQTVVVDLQHIRAISDAILCGHREELGLEVMDEPVEPKRVVVDLLQGHVFVTLRR